MNFQNKVSSSLLADAIFFNKTRKIIPDHFNSDYQINLRNWTIPFGRKFRAIRVWFMMKWFGKEGMVANSKQHLGKREVL